MANLSFEDWHEEQMKDPEYAKAYEESRPAYEQASFIIGARAKAGLSQKQLAKAAHMTVKRLDALEQMEGGMGTDKEIAMIALACDVKP